jgi:hypothetical protein
MSGATSLPRCQAAAHVLTIDPTFEVASHQLKEALRAG